jgi:hypothetical protein
MGRQSRDFTGAADLLPASTISLPRISTVTPDYLDVVAFDVGRPAARPACTGARRSTFPTSASLEANILAVNLSDAAASPA